MWFLWQEPCVLGIDIGQMKVQKYCMQFTPIMWQILEKQQCNKVHAHTLGSQKTDVYDMEALMEILFLFIQLYKSCQGVLGRSNCCGKESSNSFTIWSLDSLCCRTHAHPSPIPTDSYWCEHINITIVPWGWTQANASMHINTNIYF